MNVIARLEFELTYYDCAVHRFNHYTTRIPPQGPGRHYKTKQNKHRRIQWNCKDYITCLWKSSGDTKGYPRVCQIVLLMATRLGKVTWFNSISTLLSYSMPKSCLYIIIIIIKSCLQYRYSWFSSSVLIIRRFRQVFQITSCVLYKLLYFDLRPGQTCHSKVMHRKEVTHSNGSYERKSRRRAWLTK